MQTSRRTTLGLLAGALAGGAAKAEQPGAPATLPAAPEGYSTQADIQTAADPLSRMTAPVRLDGSAPVQFLVDTGADRTSISRETAEALKLPAAEPVLLHGVAGVLETPTVRIKSLDVGDRRLTDVIAPVLEREHLGAAGLLGLDSLRDQRLLLDFKNTRMLIQGGRRYPSDPDEIVVRARSRFGQLTLVDAWLEGQAVVVIVDSGAQSTIANAAFQERVARLRRKAIAGNTEVLSVTGQSAWGDTASIPRLKLGGFFVRNLPVVYADLHTFARWGVKDEPAMLLGVDVLRKFDRVWIDFIKREVRFRLPNDAERVPVFGLNAPLA